jgi:ABC-type sulfate transport system permease subunit
MVTAVVGTGMERLVLGAAAQEMDRGGGGIIAALGMVFTLIWLAVAVLMIASMWKIFTKAGEPGWAAIIPIYNAIVLLKIAGKPVWWIILLIIPLVGLVIGIMVAIALAQNFGKGAGFGVGLVLLPFIFGPMLGFGSAEYRPVG